MIDAAAIAAVTRCFEAMPATYIADGHHRSAAAARVAEARAAAGRQPASGDDRFLLVSFPADEVRILAYNRVVRDFDGLTPALLIAAALVLWPEGGALRRDRLAHLVGRRGTRTRRMRLPPRHVPPSVAAGAALVGGLFSTPLVAAAPPLPCAAAAVVAMTSASTASADTSHATLRWRRHSSAG